MFLCCGSGSGKPGDRQWMTINCFQAWRLDLSCPLNSLQRGLHTNLRRRIKQARTAGVRIERGRGINHLLRFYTLHLETRRRLGVPPQSLKFFRLVRQFFSGDGFEIWLASYRGCDCAAFGEREDDMKIVRLENLRFPFFDPLRTRQRLALGAMPVAAAIVAGTLVRTAVAPFEMTAEGRRPAHLDRGHDAPLCRRGRRTIVLSIDFTIAAEDVRHFQLWAIYGAHRLEG